MVPPSLSTGAFLHKIEDGFIVFIVGIDVESTSLEACKRRVRGE